MNSKEIKLEELEGCWYINMTNFSMWLKGDKTQPTFNYNLEKKGKILGLGDRVSYLKNGKEKSILGFDYPLDKNNTSFLWRGKGLLAFVSSKWSILYRNQSEHWAIIAFEKTLFTPKGYDVISRNKSLTNSQIKSIGILLKKLGIEEELTVI